ncbi:MAG: Ig-like domain-containing protein, partial [Lacipirellulaceae bacterium]
GMLTNDNVTKINQPAFEGVATAGSTVRLLANGILVGSTVAGSDSSDLARPGSTAPDGRGRWEITSEPLADGAYDITVEVEDTAGNVTTVDPQLNVGSVTDVWIDTAQPNTPFLDLTTDSGRSDADEVTNVTLPTFTITADDTPGNSFPSNPFPNDLKYRLYVRPDGNIGQPEILIVDSFLNLGAFTSGGFFTHTVSLNLNNPAGTPFPDGVHDFKLEVEDRAGNISQDFLLEITVDTTRPPVDFGQPAVIGDGLFDGSDTGVVSNPATFGDRITSDTTPTLWGIAEANSTVMLYHDTTGNGFSADDTFLGQTVANPLDGNLALPAGYWQIESALDLKLLNGGDGRVNLLAVGVDVAGNTLPPTATNSDALTIFLDTQGPQIDAVTVAGFPGYDLFDPKPSVNGHSPLINSLNVYIDDLPNRFAADFLYNAIDSNSAEQNGIFQVVGDHVGPVVIDRVFVNNIAPANGLPASAIVTVSFAAPLPDDRYTFSILDQIVDLAGNRLDGESNAIEPTDNPDVGVVGDAVRSGNDIPGGNFVGRFTVDSRPEIGSFVAQNINIDTNGNFIWDPASPLGGDATNTDLKFVMNVADPVTGAVAPGGYGLHDLVFAGQFTNGNAQASGDSFDQLAVFGWSEELDGKRWLIDTDSDGVVTDPDGINVLGAAGDVISTQPVIPGFNIATAIPVAGNFDGNAANGDEIGLYNAGQWAFDVNRDFVISAGEVLV